MMNQYLTSRVGAGQFSITFGVEIISLGVYTCHVRMVMNMKWHYASDVGTVRDQNEDVALVEEIPEGILAVVCDGLGGCLAGEVASEVAANTLRDAYLEMLEETHHPGDALEEGVRKANRRVWELSASVDEYTGMGTTLTALWTDGSRAWFASVGDSRGYLFRKGALTQVTEDQSYVWELYRQGAITKEQMVNHPMNHLISMAVGLKAELESGDIGLHQLEVTRDDLLMLCSDGLTDVMEDDAIAELLGQEGSLEQHCSHLVEEVNRISGGDNTTMLLVRI